MTYVGIAILAISIASKSPIVTWKGTHYEFMKLITRAKVLCLDMDIQKLHETFVVTQKWKVGSTYLSMVLATKDRMAS